MHENAPEFGELKVRKIQNNNSLDHSLPPSIISEFQNWVRQSSGLRIICLMSHKKAT